MLVESKLLYAKSRVKPDFDSHDKGYRGQACHNLESLKSDRLRCQTDIFINLRDEAEISFMRSNFRVEQRHRAP